MSAEPNFIALAPDTEECGEGCGRMAVAEIDGLIYCAICLERLTSLGRVFTDAIDEAKQQVARIEDR